MPACTRSASVDDLLEDPNSCNIKVFGATALKVKTIIVKKNTLEKNLSSCISKERMWEGEV